MTWLRTCMRQGRQAYINQKDGFINRVLLVPDVSPAGLDIGSSGGPGGGGIRGRAKGTEGIDLFPGRSRSGGANGVGRGQRGQEGPKGSGADINRPAYLPVRRALNARYGS